MENSSMNATDVFAGDRFGLFINLISMKDNDLHGSGLRSNEIHRNRSGSGNVNVTSSSQTPRLKLCTESL